MQDALERQEAARERVAARYKELDAERNKKKVVVMEGLVAPKQKKSGWGGARTHSLSQARRGPRAAATYGASGGSKALAKARAEVARERLALTQASGRLPPPMPTARTPRNAVQQSSLYTNPEVEAKRRPPVAVGPRIPRPRVPIPRERRADLPAHIRPEPVAKKGERFTLAGPDKGKGKAPAVSSFFEPKSRVLNSISDMKPLGSRTPERIKRLPAEAAEGEAKKRRVNSDPPRSPAQSDSAHGSPAPRASPSFESPSASAPATPARSLPLKPRKPQNLESVLFMKKKPVKRPSTVKR